MLGLFTLLAAVGAACGSARSTSQASTAATAAGTVSVSAATKGPAVPTGFLGISMEYKGLEAYAGTNPAAPDPAFVQLLRNLAPQGGFVLRIGGDSSDWSWWPVPHMAQPGGVKYDLTPLWASVARSVIAALDGHLILGINFEADSKKLAAYEADQLLSHVGASDISAFELGNEPELYASFPWYKNSAGKHVYGRAPGYSPTSYIGDFGNVASGLPKVAVAGPSSGSANWLADLGSFLSHESRVGLATVHAYPLKHCVASSFSTPQDLFTSASLQGLANQIGGWEKTAAAHHVHLRVDEMNSVSCGGQKGLSQAFAPALWALEVLPLIEQTGAVGVNFHTVPDTNNALISATETGGHWQVTVEPEFYGLIAFAQAAPTGSSFLRISAPSVSGVDAWATRGPGAQTHVVLVNTSTTARSIHLKVAGASGPAALTRLQASGLSATGGVTLAGTSLSPSTGALSGTVNATQVAPAAGGYPIELPPATATILSLG